MGGDHATPPAHAPPTHPRAPPRTCTLRNVLEPRKKREQAQEEEEEACQGVGGGVSICERGGEGVGGWV